jgi:hypothetical protein
MSIVHRRVKVGKSPPVRRASVALPERLTHDRSRRNTLVGNGRQEVRPSNLEETMGQIRRFGGIFCAALLVIPIAVAAQDTNDPETGGQLNREWGRVASDLAKKSDPDTTGGGMGSHSRSTRAANTVGGFASDSNGFGITLNVKDEEGNAGREGVGNVSKGGRHNVHPGDGGNGQHALNNEELSGVVDPVTGEAAGD